MGQTYCKITKIVIVALRCFEWVTYIYLLNIKVTYVKFITICG